MSQDRHVLILSIRTGGHVRPIAELLRKLGHRPVLLSELAADPNRDACDAHVVVDWSADSVADVIERLVKADVRPIALANQVEPLIGWQTELCRALRLTLPSPDFDILGSKLAVRRRLRDLGLSTLRFTGGPAQAVETPELFFPAIVKPSRDSGASRFVKRVDDSESMRRAVERLTEVLSDGREIVIEEFIDGIEFSLDGPVLDGRFHPLFVVEKCDHDNIRHHDAGLLVSPPNDPGVLAAQATVCDAVNALAADMTLDRVWLHVEGRSRKDGTGEIVEINTRPGGRLYRAATLHSTGVDSIEAAVRMTLPGELGDYREQLTTARRRDGMLGMVYFELAGSGVVRSRLTSQELSEEEGVLDGYVLDGQVVDDLEKENAAAEVLIEAADLEGLRAVEKRIRDRLILELE